MSVVVDWNTLPDEAYLSVFKFLEEKDLSSCCRVNSKWNNLGKDESIWKKLAQRVLSNGESLDVPSYKFFLKKYVLQHCHSNDRVIEVFQNFLNKISLGQNARFQCFVESGQVITVEVKSSMEATLPPEFYESQDIPYFLEGYDFKEEYFTKSIAGSLSWPNLPKVKEIPFILAPNEMPLKRIILEPFPTGPVHAVLYFPKTEIVSTEIEKCMIHCLTGKLHDLSNEWLILDRKKMLKLAALIISIITLVSGVFIVTYYFSNQAQI